MDSIKGFLKWMIRAIWIHVLLIYLLTFRATISKSATVVVDRPLQRNSVVECSTQTALQYAEMSLLSSSTNHHVLTWQSAVITCAERRGASPSKSSLTMNNNNKKQRNATQRSATQRNAVAAYQRTCLLSSLPTDSRHHTDNWSCQVGVNRHIRRC